LILHREGGGCTAGAARALHGTWGKGTVAAAATGGDGSADRA